MSRSNKTQGLGRRTFLQAAAVAPTTLLAGADPNAVKMAGSITDVAGTRVGHYTDKRRPTGCTVLIFDHGATVGVDVRGAAPGTRETDLLNPLNSVQKVNALLLSGGSAFGLDAATGVMRYLSEHKMGFRLGTAVVPIVPAAILFDLHIGDPKIWPDAEAGYQACQRATSDPVLEGNVGAGAGASVGALFGFDFAMKSGLGTASLRAGESGIVVGALAAVNAVGDVRNPHTGELLAGARTPDGKGLRNSMEQILKGYSVIATAGTNTTLGIVATNAAFNKTEMTKIAQMAQDGLARAINPVHTPYDGDTVFAASTAKTTAKADLSAIGAIAAEVLAEAIMQAVLAATSIPGYPAHRDLGKTTY